MRLQGLDLNLLLVFDAVMTLRSVARAATVLHVSQPAVSSAMGRLRSHFDDKLFIMKGRQLEPTPFAISLLSQVQDALAGLRHIAAATPIFDPYKSKRQFAVVASDGLSSFAINLLTRRFSRAGYGFSIKWHGNNMANFAMFLRGGADILLLRSGEYTAKFRSRTLFEETFCVIAWERSRSIRGKLKLGQFTGTKHVLIETGENSIQSPADEKLSQLGIFRDAIITLTSYAHAAAAVCGTDYLATVPLRYARDMQQYYPIKILPLPFDCDPFSQSIHWHDYADADSAVQWLIREFVKALEVSK